MESRVIDTSTYGIKTNRYKNIWNPNKQIQVYMESRQKGTSIHGIQTMRYEYEWNSYKYI